MKRLLIFSGLVIIMVMGSCKNGIPFFGKSKEKDAKIATLEQENQALKQQLKGIENEHTSEITNIRSDYEQKLAELQQKIEAGTASEYKVYYVVAGSFKNMKYAEDYSNAVKKLGYEGKIVPGPNNFNLVATGTYQTLKASLDAMKKIQDSISPEAWIYFRN